VADQPRSAQWSPGPQPRARCADLPLDLLASTQLLFPFPEVVSTVGVVGSERTVVDGRVAHQLVIAVAIEVLLVDMALLNRQAPAIQAALEEGELSLGAGIGERLLKGCDREREACGVCR